MRITFTGQGGSPGNRNTGEVGYSEWTGDGLSGAPADVSRTIDADTTGVGRVAGPSGNGDITGLTPIAAKAFWRMAKGATGVAVTNHQGYWTTSAANYAAVSELGTIIPSNSEYARIGFGTDCAATAASQESTTLYDAVMTVLYEQTAAPQPPSITFMQRKNVRHMVIR
jgi:hypothetical protein